MAVEVESRRLTCSGNIVLFTCGVGGLQEGSPLFRGFTASFMDFSSCSSNSSLLINMSAQV